MTIIYQSILTGVLLILCACAIVFPVLFLVQFHGFRKDFQKAFFQNEREENSNE